VSALGSGTDAPEVVEAAVKAYREEMQRLAASERHTRARLVKEQRETERQVARLIDAVETGAGDVEVLVSRLRELEGRGQEIAAELLSLGQAGDRAPPQGRRGVPLQGRDDSANAQRGRRRGTSSGDRRHSHADRRGHRLPNPKALAGQNRDRGRARRPARIERAGNKCRGAMVAGARNRLDLQLQELLETIVPT
jgi:hypothetical protein